MPLWLSDHAQDFLSKTLLKDPAKRSTANQLLKHPWLKSLGFKQPVDQIPSSIEIVEPVLPPRPVPLPPAEEPVVIAESGVTEEAAMEAALEDSEKGQMQQEIAVTATGAVIVLLLDFWPRNIIAGFQGWTKTICT